MTSHSIRDFYASLFGSRSALVSTTNVSVMTVPETGVDLGLPDGLLSELQPKNKERYAHLRTVWQRWVVFWSLLSILVQVRLYDLALASFAPVKIFVFAPLLAMAALCISCTCWISVVGAHYHLTLRKASFIAWLICASVVMLVFYVLLGGLFYKGAHRLADVSKEFPEELFYLADQHALVVNDDITPGFAWSIARKVAAHPDINMVLLRSGGGLLEEAVMAGDTLRHHGIKRVVVVDSCDSACTAIFFSLSERYIAQKSEVDLHGCDMVVKNTNFFIRQSSQSLMRITVALYSSGGLTAQQINQAMKMGCEDSLDITDKQLIASKIAQPLSVLGYQVPDVLYKRLKIGLIGFPYPARMIHPESYPPEMRPFYKEQMARAAAAAALVKPGIQSK